MSDERHRAIRQNLEEAAARKGWRVVVESLADEELPVGSGACSLRGERRIYVDSRVGDAAAARALAEALAPEDLEDVYLVPAARALIDEVREVRRRSR